MKNANSREKNLNSIPDNDNPDTRIASVFLILMLCSEAELRIHWIRLFGAYFFSFLQKRILYDILFALCIKEKEYWKDLNVCSVYSKPSPKYWILLILNVLS